jgi:uncharacterized protein (DUF342 family)
LGKNVHLAEDNLSVLADINGQAVMAAGKICVETVLNVDKNVDMNTGNIIFLGTVIVPGNVEDGFSVKAEGNLEINGNVGQSDIQAEGDIIIQQGISAKGKGSVKSGGNVYAKFLENASVEAGDSVIVADGIVNSQVAANKRIICNGKRAHIVGGHLRATEEINAKTIGSADGGTETWCEVGYDPRSKKRMEELSALNEAAQKEFEQAKLDLSTLENAKKQRGSLPPEKEEQLTHLMERRDELSVKLKQYKDERQEILHYLDQLRSLGRVSASERILPGVRITIREVEHSVHDEHKACSYTLHDGHVRAGIYAELPEDAIRSPNGTSTG